MVPADHAGAWIGGKLVRRKHKLPAPLVRRARILARKGIGKLHVAVACGQVGFVHGFRQCELPLQRLDAGCGQHRDPVLRALPVAHQDLAIVEVDVLDPEFEALGQAQPGAVQQACHQPLGPAHRAQQAAHLRAAQHRGHAHRPLRPLQLVQPRQRLLQHLPVKK